MCIRDSPRGLPSLRRHRALRGGRPPEGAGTSEGRQARRSPRDALSILDSSDQEERKSKEIVMKRFEGGSKVKGGFYFNQTSWDLVTVSGKDAVLPAHRHEVPAR